MELACGYADTPRQKYNILCNCKFQHTGDRGIVMQPNSNIYLIKVPLKVILGKHP